MDSYQFIALWITEITVICESLGRINKTHPVFGDARKYIEGCNYSINDTPDKAHG